MIHADERFYTLWMAQRLLAHIDKELRRVGYHAESDALLRPLIAWTMAERDIVTALEEAHGDRMARTTTQQETTCDNG